MASALSTVVIDGWGIPSSESPKDGDAITAAETPTMDAFAQNKPQFVELEASSYAVGLPKGLMGNSEVGHLNIGAGRVVWQDVVRIDQKIESGEFAELPVIKNTFEAAKGRNGRLHLCGLVSHGGVVSQSNQVRMSARSKADCVAARQAGPPVRPSPGRQEVRSPRGVHPLLR